MWMLQTYKGVASGIVYAKQGDKVNVLRIEDHLTFVEFNGEKFHVRHELLSNTPVVGNNNSTQQAPAVTEVVNPVKKQASKPINKKPSQSQLF